jgi:hypothetical protein
MRNPGSRVALALAVAILAAATLEPAPPADAPAPLACSAQAADGKDPRPHCCFTNARYVGTCEIEPAKDETCATILDYLNNPQSQGKGYCANTTIRGGWQQVPCEPKMQQD